MKTTIIATLAAFAFTANAYAYPIKAVCDNSTIAPHGVWDCR